MEIHISLIIDKCAIEVMLFIEIDVGAHFMSIKIKSCCEL